MQALGLFSGIGGFELAMSRAGIDLVGMCEINPRCRQVLSRQFEGVPIYEDVKNVSIATMGFDYGDINLITGGFPCQDVSTAGKRAGLAGERSGLWFEFLRIIREARPEWVVIENVPGLLSSNRGKDFETILNGLVGVGYSVAWRVFDAQHFGLAQQRRRLFIVGHLAGGRAAEILFEPEGGTRNFETSEAMGNETANAITTGVGTYRGNGFDNLILAESDRDIAKTVAARSAKAYSPETTTFVIDKPRLGQDIAYALTASIGTTYCDPDDNIIPVYYSHSDCQDRIYDPCGKSPALLNSLSGGAWKIFQVLGVRRLTPVECARLQGFPDDWCEGLSDTAQYEAYGNAVAVPVVEWILNRIVETYQEGGL